MQPDHEGVQIRGGDTSQPMSMAKRLDVVRQHLPPNARRFLDCGCGSGAYVAALMQQFGLDAHGVEFDERKVEAAQENEILRGRISKGDIEALNSPDGAWDCVMLNEVLEHVPDDRKALAEVCRVLKPGGRLFLFSPNRWFPFESHGVQLKRPRREVPRWIPFVPYVPGWLGRFIFVYWARNYGQFELARMVREAGFVIVGKTFVWQTFENISKNQPGFIAVSKPLLRSVCNVLERTPVLRRFGLSQVLVCRK